MRFSGLLNLSSTPQLLQIIDAHLGRPSLQLRQQSCLCMLRWWRERVLPTLSFETRDCGTAPSKRSAFRLRQRWDVNGIAQRSAFLGAVNLGGWQSHSNAVPAAGLAVTRAASGAGDSKRRASASWKALTGKRRKLRAGGSSW